MNRLSTAARLLLSLPILASLLVMFLGPMAMLVRYSFTSSEDLGVAFIWTLDSYRVFWEQPVYWQILAKTLGIAALVSGLAVLIGFPAAWFMARAPRPWRTPLLVLLVIPWWASFIVRVFAWFTMFGNSGVINRTLDQIGLIDSPLAIFTFGVPAIVVTELNLYLPLMIIPIYMSLERLDWTMLLAARSLGARRAYAFRRVVLPYSLPGIVAGVIFVFMPICGSFVVPQLVGGTRGLMFGKVIASQLGEASNWALGAALSVILLVALAVCLGLLLVVRRRFSAEAFG